MRNGYTIAKCRELKTALNELANKGQINRFLKHGVRAFEKALLRSAQKVTTAGSEKTVSVPIMTFEVAEGHCAATSHDDSLVIKLKVASELVRKILTDTESCQHTGNDTVAPTVWRKGQVQEHIKVDVPTTCNVILGRSTLHRVKAVATPYLLQFQHEADDDTMG
ncbi:hypothetical protein Cgig2_033939 [Carnegiea gigantea]|uniref:Uncharacterized protein n=1 Tax=Carnegiea gigantea TaxID=171969 RepID=A0A9Q1GV81_9CARY|nr:hypothetical protein Cgig2_033939 [Carnegiea gigantea]